MLPIIGTAVTAGLEILKKLIPDPAERRVHELELMKLNQEGKFKEMDHRFEAIVMEAKSADPWTSRARPSFMYVFYILILSSIPIGILFIWFPEEVHQGITGFQLWLEAIPPPLYTLFGAGYLGYTGARSYDKAKLVEGKK